MTTWNTMTSKQQTATQLAFNALSTLDAITDNSSALEDATRKLGFSDLYSFVTGPDSTMDEELERALMRDNRLRDDLDRLLDNTAQYHAEYVAAASSGNVSMRQGKGFAIRLHESRAAPQQVYIIIELEDAKATPPTALFLCGSQATYQKRVLPEPQDGTIQMLENLDSEMVASLRDIDTQVFLR